MQNMYFVLTIVNRSDNKDFVEFFDKNQVNNIYSMPAHGTASASVLDLLGIARSEKTIHFSLLVHSKMKRVLAHLTSDMLIDLPGKGIALAIPLSSIASRDALNYFHDEDASANETQKSASESEDKKMNNTELIVVICENGHTDLIMDAAREAGARGGTVTHAKGTGSQYTAKFLGLSIAEEKEIIYIVSTTDQKQPIMKAIMAKAGGASEAHAVVFSLPVSDTAGLRLFDNKNE